MASRYEVRVKDRTGEERYRTRAYHRLFYTRKINAPGEFTLEIAKGRSESLDSLADYLANIDSGDDHSLDAQIEIWREDTDAGITLYLDFEGFHRTGHRYQTEQGVERVVSYGRGYNDLLNVGVGYPSLSAGAVKSGTGETVIKAYVEENLGSLSTVANGRDRTIDLAGFSVEVDYARGDVWTGSRPRQNLLDVCQEIGHCVGGLDFQIVGMGRDEVLGIPTFQFQVRVPQWGEDRTNRGVDPLTGLNAAGNAPVVFSVDFANMLVPQYSVSYTGAIPVVMALGQGIEADRTVYVKENTEALSLSHLNVREAYTNANTEDTTAGLDIAATTRLHELEARRVFDFVALQSAAVKYGRDYGIGDIVTATYGGVTVHRKISEVAVAIGSTTGVGQAAKDDIRITVSETEEGAGHVEH